MSVITNNHDNGKCAEEESKSSKFALTDELKKIAKPDLRAMVASFLIEKVPDYFWSIPASSTGKYHPVFSQGEGGLIRHTQMVVAVAEELLKAECSDIRSINTDTDIIYAACILHDTFKNGNINSGHTVTSHPSIAADEWVAYCEKNKFNHEAVEQIATLIECHMGKWNRHVCRDAAIKHEAEIVHYADYIASRKFFDKFMSMPIASWD